MPASAMASPDDANARALWALKAVALVGAGVVSAVAAQPFAEWAI